MPVSLFTFGIEPQDTNEPIWRFLEFWKFQDLMKGRLYFHRSDLYAKTDPQEGMPLDSYANLPGRHPLDINDIQERTAQLGFDAQIRQGYYISSWYLAVVETAKMWRQYAPENGVAVCSTYAKLKAVLEPLPADDRAHLGLVQYGDKHVPRGRRNLIANIGTKGEKFQDEKEVRAMLWIVNPHETGNRNIDPDNRVLDRPMYPTDNPEGIWRSVDIPSMLTKVIVSPFAEQRTKADAEREIAAGGYNLPVELSEMTAHASFIPTAEELQRYG
jgi:hypothetical protein